MNIQDTIAQIDALYAAANDLDDVFAVQAQATVKHKLFEHWPTISAELKRLQEELGMAIFQKNLLEESFNMAMAEVGQQQATIEKAREMLEHFATIKPLTGSADQISRVVRMLARDALAALDGLARDAGNGWISVKDRLPEYGVEVETLFQYARSVSGPFIAKNTFHEWTDSDGTKRLGWSYTPGNPTHWRYAPAWPAAPKGGE